MMAQTARSDSRLRPLISDDTNWIEHGIVDALVFKAKQLSEGGLGPVLRDSITVETAEDGLVRLHFGVRAIGKMNREQAEINKKTLEWVLDDMESKLRESPDYADLAKTVADISRMERKLREELAVIRLRRIVPGRCKYCPL